MAKVFSIVKKIDLNSGKETAVNYVYAEDELDRKRILKRLEQSSFGPYTYRYDEGLTMHLPGGLSQQTVRELSCRRYYTAYALCKVKGKKEKVLYLALLKDTALRYKAALPDALIKHEQRMVPNPAYLVKELKIAL